MLQTYQLGRPRSIFWVLASCSVFFLMALGASFSGQAHIESPGGIGQTAPNPVATAPTTIPTDTPSPLAKSTDTPAPNPTDTFTPTPTDTPDVPSPEPSVEPTICPINFTDVHPDDWFYEPVRWLVCHSIASGYADGTFRPGNSATRAQIAKIIVLAAQWTLEDPPIPRFSDVPHGSTFYAFVETAAAHGIISGYADGTFRPGNSLTRGQLSKVVVLARSWELITPPTPTFSDVLSGSPFYSYVETAVRRGIISGYANGTFRPGNPATRAQVAKIVQGAFTSP